MPDPSLVGASPDKLRRDAKSILTVFLLGLAGLVRISFAVAPFGYYGCRPEVDDFAFAGSLARSGVDRSHGDCPDCRWPLAGTHQLAYTRELVRRLLRSDAAACIQPAVITGRSLQPFHYEQFIANYVALIGLVVAAAIIWQGWRGRQRPIRYRIVGWLVFVALWWAAMK